MSKYFILFLLPFYCHAIQAQNYIATPNPSYAEADVNDTSTEPDNMMAPTIITNNTSDTLFLNWERVVNNKPYCWETAVCDVNLHYSHSVNSRNFLLPPNSMNGKLNVFAYSGGEPGSDPTSGEGEVVLKISNLNDPSDTLLVEYHFSVTGDVDCVTSISDIEKEALKIYPNPTTDFFRVTESLEVYQLTIYNILGCQIKHFDVTSNQKYNISHLANGVYIVELTNEDQEIINTIKLQKL